MSEINSLYFERGWIRVEIFASESAILKIDFVDECKSDNPNGVLKLFKEELSQYFEGKLRSFSVPYEIHGSEFQMRVWEELVKIPYGKCISYKELALRAGDQKACRAVGNANGKNPLPILIPCHRVISTNGTLGGYSGGVEYKKALLEVEGLYV